MADLDSVVPKQSWTSYPDILDKRSALKWAQKLVNAGGTPALTTGPNDNPGGTRVNYGDFMSGQPLFHEDDRRWATLGIFACLAQLGLSSPFELTKKVKPPPPNDAPPSISR